MQDSFTGEPSPRRNLEGGLGWVSLDAEGRVVEADAGYLRLTGRAVLSDIVGAGVSEWTAAYDLPRSEAWLRKCLEEGSARDFEVDYVDPSGRATPVAIDAKVLPPGEGVRILALCKDITERLRVERSRRDMEELFDLFMEFSTAYVFFKDADLRPIRLSRNYEKLLGRPLDQILGKTMEELFPPELAKAMSEDDRRIIQENALVTVDEELGGRFFTTLKFPVVRAGRPTFLAGITLDITERRMAEAALVRGESKFRSLFEAMVEGVGIHEMICDDRGKVIDYRFVDANPAYESQTGISRGACLGRLASEFFGTQEPPLLEEFRQVAETGRPYVFEGYSRILGKQLHLHLFPIQQGQGAIAAIFEDISERKRNEEERRRLEAEIQHAQQLDSLGSLAGGVAHDMNNLLQAIQGMASVLKVKCAQNPGLGPGLDIILNATDRGRNLVKNLTDFARKGLQEPGPLDLNQIVRKEVDMLRHTTLQRIELQADLEEGLPRILGDPSAIGNALMNLCINALDAMPGKGRLRFRTRRVEENGVELVVEDTGHGMPAEIRQRAMEPFFTTKPVGKGTGLGLSGVYGTMKAHGGTMELESEEGRGTRVILRFNALDEPAEVQDRRPQATPDRRTARPLKMLLVDDDDLIRDSFPDLMTILGHQVVETAADGNAGLRLLAEGLDVDVVFLDHNMPGLSGLETLARIRVLRPELPIVFCTGLMDESLQETLKESRRVWILAKPYSLKDIRPLLDALARA